MSILNSRFGLKQDGRPICISAKQYRSSLEGILGMTKGESRGLSEGQGAHQRGARPNKSSGHICSDPSSRYCADQRGDDRAQSSSDPDVYRVPGDGSLSRSCTCTLCLRRIYNFYIAAAMTQCALRR